MMINCKLKDVKLRAGLRSMLNQFSLTVVIVGDSVLVTTEEQAIYKQLKHRVSVDYENVALNKALKELAQVNGVNIVVDPRTFKTKANEAPVVSRSLRRNGADSGAIDTIRPPRAAI